jgi:hypothetical protein
MDVAEQTAQADELLNLQAQVQNLQDAAAAAAVLAAADASIAAAALAAANAQLNAGGVVAAPHVKKELEAANKAPHVKQGRCKSLAFTGANSGAVMAPAPSVKKGRCKSLAFM